MISKSKSERKTTIKIDAKQLNGIRLEAMMEDRPASYILKKKLKAVGVKELTDEEFEFRVRKMSSAMEVTV